MLAAWCRLSKEHSKDLQSVVVVNGAASKAAAAAAAAAANGEDASRLVGGQPTAIPAALSTEAAAAAAVGSGAGLTLRKGWFSRGRAGKGGAADGTLADAQDGEEKPKEQPVKVGGSGGDMLAGVMPSNSSRCRSALQDGWKLQWCLVCRVSPCLTPPAPSPSLFRSPSPACWHSTARSGRTC